MKIKELQNAVKILSRVCNNVSITPLYRSFELSATGIRACSEFGNLEMWFDTGAKVDAPAMLNTAAFVGVINSLPDELDLLIIQDGQQVKWKCGGAKGSWSLVQQEHTIPFIDHANFPWAPPKELAKALTLGSSACQAVTVSIGIFGVVVEPIGSELRITSSNAISLASVSILGGGYSGGKVTLRPPVPTVWAAILDVCGDKVRVDVTDKGIFVVGDWLVAHLPLTAPLDQDLALVMNRFQTSVYKTPVDSALVGKFLARAKVLAEKGSATFVTLKIAEGQLALEHVSIGASTEEYFLASGLDPSWAFASVSLPVELMSASLQHVSFAVLDYLSENFLVLIGENPTFKQIIGGKAN